MPLKLQPGMKFGDWTVIERDYHPTSKQHSTFWFCKCELCGKIYSVSRNSLVKNMSSCCNHCKGEKTRQTAIENRYGLLTVIDRPKTKNNHSYVKCKCDCGNIVEVRVEHLKGQCGHGRTISCGCSKWSSGELKIAQLFKNNNINFKTQYRIKEFNISAPFDFALFQNNRLIGLLEYDGEQHFKSVEWWGGEKQLKIQQQRDKNKDEWCKENNIKLVRIPYTDYDKITIEYLLSFFPELSYSEIENTFGENFDQTKTI